MDRSDGWLQAQEVKDHFKKIEARMNPGTYFVGDVSLLLSERERAELESFVFPEDIEDLFEGGTLLESGRRIVIFRTICTKGTHIDSGRHKYNLRYPVIGITLFLDNNDPLIQCGRLVTYTKPFICSCYDIVTYDEGLIPYPVRLLDFGPDVKFRLTDEISHPGMKLTSDPKAGRVRTWQNTNHFEKNQPISNAVLFWLQAFNV